MAPAGGQSPKKLSAGSIRLAPADLVRNEIMQLFDDVRFFLGREKDVAAANGCRKALVKWRSKESQLISQRAYKSV